MSKYSKNAYQKKIRSQPKEKNIVDFCVKNFTILGSKTAVKKAIQNHELLVNRKVVSPNYVLKTGDFIQLKFQKSNVASRPKFDLDIPVVFEDKHLIIVNKPGGIAVNGNRNKTVENAVMGIAKNCELPDRLNSPTAVHRLDVPTKGLVILAKTKTALIRLNKAFQTGKVDKSYFAVVHGKPPKNGHIKSPIQGKKCHTQFELIRTVPSQVYGHLSLLQLKPITGRTHQLRIHSKELGHLIVGDKMYAGKQRTILGKGLFLCACTLQFEHPISEKNMSIQIPVPNRFNRLLDKEKTRF